MGDEKKSYSSQAIDLDLKIQDAELIENYTDLRVYKLAFESAVHIFELAKKWPAEEKYSLTDQIRRCSRSVCANIAGWRHLPAGNELAVVALAMHPPAGGFGNLRWQFVAGILLAALGGCLVTLYKPGPGPPPKAAEIVQNENIN